MAISVIQTSIPAAFRLDALGVVPLSINRTNCWGFSPCLYLSDAGQSLQTITLKRLAF